LVVSNTPKDILLGLLAWASVASNYGSINGTDTCNWGMIGRPGHQPLPGHVQDESGTFLVRIFEPEDGIRAFLERVSVAAESFDSQDIGSLSMAMIQSDAMGPKIENTEESWLNMCKLLRTAMDRIAQDTNMPMNWSIKKAHPAVEKRLKTKEIQAESQEEESPKKKSIWPWILGGGALLVGGYFLVRKMNDDESAPSTTPVTTQEILEENHKQLKA